MLFLLSTFVGNHNCKLNVTTTLPFIRKQIFKLLHTAAHKLFVFMKWFTFQNRLCMKRKQIIP